MKNAPLLFLLLAVLFASQGLDAREIPKLTGRVVDGADMLSSGEEQALTQKLADYEQQTTNQIVVVTIPSLEGEVLEGYSMRIAEKWKIGQKGKDNGVILLIARDDRKIRIEVGYGLEPVLTDGISGDIIRNTIAPRFKEGKFYEGINDGINNMSQAIGGDLVSEQAREKKKFSEVVLDKLYDVLLQLIALSKVVVVQVVVVLIKAERNPGFLRDILMPYTFYYALVFSMFIAVIIGIISAYRMMIKTKTLVIHYFIWLISAILVHTAFLPYALTEKLVYALFSIFFSLILGVFFLSCALAITRDETIFGRDMASWSSGGGVQRWWRLLRRRGVLRRWWFLWRRRGKRGMVNIYRIANRMIICYNCFTN